jgi:hypothetical protein
MLGMQNIIKAVNAAAAAVVKVDAGASHMIDKST